MTSHIADLEFESLLPKPVRYTFTLGNEPCFVFSISQGNIFRNLTDLAMNNTVKVFVPTVPGDCCIRFTMEFNQDILKNLFGYVTEVYPAGELPLFKYLTQLTGSTRTTSAEWYGVRDSANAWSGCF